MKVMVIGKGGREHAIVDKVSQSKLVDELYALPGNDGMKEQAQLVDINVYHNHAIVEFAKEKQIDLVIIGPEISLKSGLSDDLQAEGIKVLGATAKAAQIETSKNYAKKLMKKYRIPTPDYEFFTEYNEAVAYIKGKGVPIVIKYDGLAAGKGVHVIKDKNQAVEVLRDLLVDKSMGDIGVVVEDYIAGDEFTLMALVNGSKVYPLQISRDFKRVYDNDEGPNTGGMGSITPYINVSAELHDQAVAILERTAESLIDEGNPYTGILYGGFIYNEDGLSVLEYNARFGDPETETALHNLESDLVQNILDLLDDKQVIFKYKDTVSVGLVLSAPGYPEDNTIEAKYARDIRIDDYLHMPFKVYAMGVYEKDGHFYNNAGRVLFVLNEGKTSKEAFNEIYNALEKVPNNCLHYRKDLGEY